MPSRTSSVSSTRVVDGGWTGIACEAEPTMPASRIAAIKGAAGHQAGGSCRGLDRIGWSTDRSFVCFLFSGSRHPWGALPLFPIRQPAGCWSDDLRKYCGGSEISERESDSASGYAGGPWVEGGGRECVPGHLLRPTQKATTGLSMVTLVRRYFVNAWLMPVNRALNHGGYSRGQVIASFDFMGVIVYVKGLDDNGQGVA